MSKKDVREDAVQNALDLNHLNHERWENALLEGSVLGLRCSECGYVTATPKAACTRCGSRSISVVELPDTGTVYTKTTVEIAPDEHGHGYQIALVDLGDARLLVRIADGYHVDIDDEVELVGTYEHAGDIAAVFKPID